ncbi:MBOAT_2 domain-containing protein, partial [Haematococcus lacustris]
MKDVLLSTSLADMWGQKWHQYFRSDHYNLAQRPTQAALDWAGSRLGTEVTASPHWRNIRRAVTVMAVFVFNGVIHEYMNWAGLGISDGMHL